MTDYILNEKLPSEYALLKEEVDMMTRVAEGPPPTQERIEQLRVEVSNCLLNLTIIWDYQELKTIAHQYTYCFKTVYIIYSYRNYF